MGVLFTVAGRPADPHPRTAVLVSTGNISNAELERLLMANLPALM